MSFLATVNQSAAENGVRFLVIGGLAVNVYGYSRDTSDLDFFISQDERPKWLKLLEKLGYSDYRDGGNFIQYETPQNSAWPVDLMLVHEKTFGPIFEAGMPADIFGVTVKVPTLEHLIILKLHALKNTRMHRFLKDFLDVENLIRINKIDVKSQMIRDLFEKYGTAELYEKISRSLTGE